MKLIKKPTVEQEEIINFDGNLLVTAVPGSGKTKTIIDKVEKLANEVDSKQIIVITYTYRAANEIKERLELRNIIDENVWSGTIHRFCLEFIINPNQSLIPELSKGYEIADEDDVNQIVNMCAGNLGINVNRNDPPDLTVNLEGGYAEKRLQYIPLVKEVYQHFKEHKIINFDMILYYSYQILKKFDYVVRNIAYASEWIIVDEYQDTKELQYQIISCISAKNENLKLMFVGDPNQAIYTNLGGVVKNKLLLDELNDRNFTEKHLTGCFRSHQRIIDFYNLFACQREEINSMKKEQVNSSVKYYQNADLNSCFAELTKKSIEDFYIEGIQYNEICVALPWGIHLMNLSSWFLRNAPEIPIDAPSITPLKKMDDSVWNNLIKLLFIKIDYNNVFYYERLINLSLSEISKRFGVNCSTKNDSLMDYYISCSFSDDEIATDVIREQSEKIFGDILGLSPQMYKIQVDHIIDATDAKIRRFSSVLSNEVSCFRQCYKSKNGVVFSTFHGCKGEEYRAVIVGGLNEGYIPHLSRLNYRDDSMKLLYVVMSRAKEKLVISSTSPQGRRYKVNREIENCDFAFDI